jgi:hypothetical protein
MQTDIVTLCHSAIEQGGNLSMLGAFDSITVKTLPHPFPPFSLAVRARFGPEEAGDHELRVTVADTDGRILAQMRVAFRLPPESFRPTTTMSIVFPISGMELRGAGEHVIDLILDGQAPLRTPFQVHRA